MLRGLYRFSADVGTFEDCDSGARLPVAQEGSNFILEGAYLRLFSTSGNAPGVLATIDGRVLPREDPNGNRRNTVVIDRFISMGGDTCPPPPGAAPVSSVPRAPLTLENTRWKVEQLNQKPVEEIEKQREPYVVLQSASKRVTGSGSCNQLLLAYTLEGSALRFTEGGVTARTCTSGMEQEKAFLAALSDVEKFSIEGRTLRMLDAQGRVVVQLRAEEI